MAAHVDDEQAVTDSETGASHPWSSVQWPHRSEIHACTVDCDDLRTRDGGNADGVHAGLCHGVSKTGGCIGPALNASEEMRLKTCLLGIAYRDYVVVMTGKDDRLESSAVAFALHEAGIAVPLAGCGIDRGLVRRQGVPITAAKCAVVLKKRVFESEGQPRWVGKSEFRINDWVLAGRVITNQLPRSHNERP